MIEQNRLRGLNIILFFLSLVMLVVHIEGMVRFNRREIQTATARSRWKSTPARTAPAPG